MGSACTTVILLVLLAIIFLVGSRRFHCTEDEIVKCFRRHGAVTQETAKTLKEMRLHSESKPFLLMRDRQAELLSQLWQQGIIHEVKGEIGEQVRYYLDGKFVKQGINIK